MLRSNKLITLDPIRRFRLCLADQPELHVAVDLGAVAFPGIAEAAAARHVDDQAFAGRDGLEALGLELLARRQRQPAVAAGLAAVAAARRMFYPLEVAKMPNGAPSRCSTSMTWPRPPRYWPAPP